MIVVSIEQYRDCQNNRAYALSLLEDPIRISLLTTGSWESPAGLPADVLSFIAASYRERGWKVTWKNGSKRIRIWHQEKVCVTRAKR